MVRVVGRSLDLYGYELFGSRGKIKGQQTLILYTGASSWSVLYAFGSQMAFLYYLAELARQGQWGSTPEKVLRITSSLLCGFSITAHYCLGA